MRAQQLKLKKENWLNYGQWEQPPFSAAYWIHWYNKAQAEKAGFKNLNGKLMMLNGYTLTDRHDLDCIKTNLDEACLKKDFNFALKFRRLALLAVKQSQKNIRFNSANNLKVNFASFIKTTEELMTPWYLSVIIGDYLGELLSNSFQKMGLNINNVVDYVPEKTTLMIKQSREAMAIKKELGKGGFLNKQGVFINSKLKKLSENKKLWSLISRHLKEYEWVGTHHFWGEPLSLSKFLKDLEHYQIDKNKRPKKIKFSSDLNFKLRLSGEFIYWRQYLAEIFDLIVYRQREFLTTVAKSLGLKYEELMYLTPREVQACLNGAKVDLLLLAKRKKDCCVSWFDNKEFIFQESTDINYLKKMFLENFKKVDSLAGVPAYPGRVRGRAKIFLIPENFSKMNTGDILVTTMTTPDFVPLMKRAGGIVTDVGGLLSHAAIVSRELGKPCVIATKAATKIFKDNDLIEVDAEKGIVRLIK